MWNSLVCPFADYLDVVFYVLWQVPCLQSHLCHLPPLACCEIYLLLVCPRVANQQVLPITKVTYFEKA